MKKFESVIMFRCECGEVIKTPFPAFDMKEMREEENGEAYENLCEDVVCDKCGKYFHADIEASVMIGFIDEI